MDWFVWADYTVVDCFGLCGLIGFDGLVGLG